MRIDSRSLVLLVGASGSGKSTWARHHFRAEQIVSSDALRAAVGQTDHDQRASADAFDLLDRIVAMRIERRLLTVVDTTGLDAPRRVRFLELAREAEVPAVAVLFEVAAAEVKRRNAGRERPVPGRVVTAHLKQIKTVRAALVEEGWDVLEPGPSPPDAEPARAPTPPSVAVVPPAFVAADTAAARQAAAPVGLTFGLSLPRFAWADAPGATRGRLVAVAQAAEEAGFASLHVMDHFVQIPSFGPVWEDMLESTTTLGFLAGVTERIELGALVTGVTHRNLAVLGKAVATLDVLSGGRAVCGLGAGWFEREHAMYGLDFPARADRFRLLEDALRFLPLLWGPGAPAFEGHTFSAAEAACYPRPLRQPRPPITVGGNGERRTLRLAAEYADACNILGGVEVVRRKVAVLRAHGDDVGRDPAEVTVTQLGDVVAGRDRAEVGALIEALRRDDHAPETTAGAHNAGTVDDHIGRFRELADAGVDRAIVSFPPVATVDAVERFAPVINAFR